MVTEGEWLGAELKCKGVNRTVADRTKGALLDAVREGMWSMDDVPAFAAMDEAHLDESCKMLKRFFGALLTDIETVSKAAVLKAGKGDAVAFSATERLRLDEWLDGLVQSFRQPTHAPQKLSGAQVEQMEKDLKAQGMQAEEDLLWFELTRHTGRPAAPGDTEGGIYLGKASATKGGIAHRKAGEETYAKVLKEAVANADFARIERWNEHLVDVLSASEHRFAGQAGMLLMGMMQKLRATLGAGEHALLYLQMHEDTFTGRGFPNGKEVDDGIYKAVIGTSFVAPAHKTLDAIKGPARGPPSETGGSTASLSSFPTSIGTSASDKSTALDSQFSKMLEAIGGLGSKLDEQSEKLSTVTRRLQSVEDKVEHQAKGPKCNKCKQFGHIAANCTAKKEE